MSPHRGFFINADMIRIKSVMSTSRFYFIYFEHYVYCLMLIANRRMALVRKSLSNKKHVLGIFIDLSKAFDEIDHYKMLKKLECYGIRGTILNLIKNYFT